MLRFIARRSLLSLLILLLAVSLLFGMIHLVPGDPASVILGPRASPELRAEINQRMGLDKPLIVQLGNFYRNLARGDLGTDVFSNRAVSDISPNRFTTESRANRCSRVPPPSGEPRAEFAARTTIAASEE